MKRLLKSNNKTKSKEVKYIPVKQLKVKLAKTKHICNWGNKNNVVAEDLKDTEVLSTKELKLLKKLNRAKEKRLGRKEHIEESNFLFSKLTIIFALITLVFYYADVIFGIALATKELWK